MEIVTSEDYSSLIEKQVNHTEFFYILFKSCMGGGWIGGRIATARVE